LCELILLSVHASTSAQLRGNIVQDCDESSVTEYLYSGPLVKVYNEKCFHIRQFGLEVSRHTNVLLLTAL